MILLRLYPRAWRKRYETEILALLEGHDVTLATRLDLLRGALDAWHEQRSVMAPIPTVARRAAWLGVIPSVVIIATFLLGLVVRSQFLVAYLGLGALPAVAIVCVWAGIWAATGRRTLRGRLGAGLVAGASAGLVASALEWVVIIGLMVAQVAFGLWVSPIPPLNGSVEMMAANLLNVTMLLVIVAGLLGTVTLGAGIGAVGAALSAILPGRSGHPGQHPTAS